MLGVPDTHKGLSYFFTTGPVLSFCDVVSLWPHKQRDHFQVGQWSVPCYSSWMEAQGTHFPTVIHPRIYNQRWTVPINPSPHRTELTMGPKAGNLSAHVYQGSVSTSSRKGMNCNITVRKRFCNLKFRRRSLCIQGSQECLLSVHPNSTLSDFSFPSALGTFFISWWMGQG